MRGISFLILCLSVLVLNRAKATHIVGGDFTITYVGGSGNDEYEMSLILYYDLEKGIDIPDTAIQINAFRIRDKAGAGEFVLIKNPNPIYLGFRDESCRDEAFAVQAFRYTKIVKLDPFRYSDPSGYYAVWQRCCRNAGINNVSNSIDAGMAYYLEFPDVVQYPRNSLPKFDSILREYFCVGQIATFSAGASEPDGDSLYFSLEIPIRGNATNQGNTIINDPGPYPLESGYTPIPGIAGTEGISIDPANGEITLAPRNIGVFLFSARCQEFRNGVKLGEVRRDFEIVVDNCLPNDSPLVQLLPRGWDRPYQYGRDTIFIRDTTDFCHTLLVDDPDGNQNLMIDVSPGSSSGVGFELLPRFIIPEKGNYENSEICLPLCFSKEEQEPFEISISVEDDACPRGQKAIQRVLVAPDFPRNQIPELESDFKERTYRADEIIEFEVSALDPDPEDWVTIDLSELDRLQGEYGLDFVMEPGIGEANGFFRWNPDCRVKDLESLSLSFLAYDNKCNGDESEILDVVIRFEEGSDEVFELRPIQNVITPNQDGQNDYLDLSGITNYECQYGKYIGYLIFDRWGVKIAEVEGDQFSWTPGNLQAGTYYYQVQFERGELKGYFQLIR